MPPSKVPPSQVPAGQVSPAGQPPDDFWDRMGRRGPATVTVAGTPVRAGSRVRLRPRAGADIFDLALAGQVAVVERVEQDETGAVQLAVTLADDPGRDLGEALMPGHRFFFAPQDVEPLPGPALAGSPPPGRALVAGIGNVFLGDDGFGVAVVHALAQRPLPPEVDVVDFGIRGLDLVYALGRDYHGVIFVDAAARGEPAGTLTVLDPEVPDHPVGVQTHGVDPVSALALARQLGPLPPYRRVVCCEPSGVLVHARDEDLAMALSSVVQAAVDRAVRLVESLLAECGAGGPAAVGGTGAEQRRGGEPG